MNPEDLRDLAEDLEFLGKWTGSESNAEVRRGTATLRRLLIDDVYGAGWRHVGKPKQPTLVAIDLNALIGKTPLTDIVVAVCGGAFYGGLQIAGMCLQKGATPPAAPEPQARLRIRGFPGDRIYTLSQFLDSPSGLVAGVTFSRRDVIKYIANIRGGVHANAQVRPGEEELVARMRVIEDRVKVASGHGLLFEVTAIAQAVGDSDDARWMRNHILGR